MGTNRKEKIGHHHNLLVEPKKTVLFKKNPIPLKHGPFELNNTNIECIESYIQAQNKQKAFQYLDFLQAGLIKDRPCSK
jgi:hypothetical protein